MAGRRLRYIDEILNVSMYVQVTCGGCGRRAVYAPFNFRSYVRSLKQATDLESLGPKMLCSPKWGGCGHRGATIMPIDWPPPSPPPSPLVDLLKDAARQADETKQRKRH